MRGQCVAVLYCVLALLCARQTTSADSSVAIAEITPVAEDPAPDGGNLTPIIGSDFTPLNGSIDTLINGSNIIPVDGNNVTLMDGSTPINGGNVTLMDGSTHMNGSIVTPVNGSEIAPVIYGSTIPVKESFVAYEKSASFKFPPYEMKLECGFPNGSEIIVKGQLYNDTDRIQLTICEHNSERNFTKCPLYADVWLNNNTIDLKTFFGGVWNESRRYRKLPLDKGYPFSVTIRSEIEKYVIYLNDFKSAQFKHDALTYDNTVFQIAHVPVVDNISYSFPERGGSLMNSCKDSNNVTHEVTNSTYTKTRRRMWTPSLGSMVPLVLGAALGYGAARVGGHSSYGKNQGWGQSYGQPYGSPYGQPYGQQYGQQGWGQSHGQAPGWGSPAQGPTYGQSYGQQPGWGQSQGHSPGWGQPHVQAPGWGQPPAYSPGIGQQHVQTQGMGQPPAYSPGMGQQHVQTPGFGQPPAYSPGMGQQNVQTPGLGQPPPYSPGIGQPHAQSPGMNQPSVQSPGWVQASPNSQSSGGTVPKAQAPGWAISPPKSNAPGWAPSAPPAETHGIAPPQGPAATRAPIGWVHTPAPTRPHVGWVAPTAPPATRPPATRAPATQAPYKPRRPSGKSSGGRRGKG